MLLYHLLHIVDWLEQHMISCPSKRYLHIECPGCGLQRSIIALMRGNMGESLHYYPATIPLIILFGYTTAHLLFKFKQGATFIKWMQIFSASLILLSFLYKIIYHRNFF